MHICIMLLFHVFGYSQAGEEFRKISVAYLFGVVSSYHVPECMVELVLFHRFMRRCVSIRGWLPTTM